MTDDTFHSGSPRPDIHVPDLAPPPGGTFLWKQAGYEVLRTGTVRPDPGQVRSASSWMTDPLDPHLLRDTLTLIEQARTDAPAIQNVASFNLHDDDPDETLPLVVTLTLTTGHPGKVTVRHTLMDTAPLSVLAHTHVVALRAREVLQQVAELVGLHDAQVDRHARVSTPAGGVLAGDAVHGLDDVELREGGDQHSRIRRRGDDVEVLARVRPAPGAARELDAVGRRVRPEGFDDPLRDRQRLVEEHPRRRLAWTPPTTWATPRSEPGSADSKRSIRSRWSRVRI